MAWMPAGVAVLLAGAGCAWVLLRGRPVAITDLEMGVQTALPAVVALAVAFERVARAFGWRHAAAWAPGFGLFATCGLAVPMALGVQLPSPLVGCMLVLWLWGPISLAVVAVIAVVEWGWRRRSATNTQAEHAMTAAVFVGLTALAFAGIDGGIDAPYRWGSAGVFACRVGNGIETERTTLQPVDRGTTIEVECRGPLPVTAAKCVEVAAVPTTFYRCSWNVLAPSEGNSFEVPVPTAANSVESFRLQLRGLAPAPGVPAP